MAASGSQSIARSRGVPATGQDSQPDVLAAGWLAIVPAAITLAVTLYRIGVPSFTRDEGATLLAVHRSFGQLLRMLGNVDVVHTEYYALIWVVTRLGGSGELATRAPSAVAMAVAAGGVTLLGQRLVNGRAGLAAGLLFAVFPSVSFYAEDAREYALVAALATVASYLLIRALQAAAPLGTAQVRQPAGITGGFHDDRFPGPAGRRDEVTEPAGQRGVPGGRAPGPAQRGVPGGRPPGPAGPGDEAGAEATAASGGLRHDRPAASRAGGRPGGPAAVPRYGWLAGYAVALALLGLGNILSLLLIAAHAVTVAVWLRHRGGPARRFVLRWLASAAVALVVASPIAVIAAGQAHQVRWIKPPGLVAIIAMAGLIGPRPMFGIVVLVVALALVTGLLARRLRTDWPVGLLGLAVPWLFLPPALLFTVSVVHVTHPLYVFRYITFCIPAAALLAGTALAALARAAAGWIVAVAALAIIAIAGLPAQAHQRIPAGHGYGIRQADQVVARRARPGDALMNIRYWPLSWGGGVERGMAGVYPYGLARLHDISLARAPVPSASLGGTFAPASVERQRLATVTRVWVASWSKAPSWLPQRLGFTLEYTVHTKGVWVRLYTRPHAAAAAHTTAAGRAPAR